jgi:hypothetical protein
VYVETNFLLAVATGREARADELVAAAPSSARLVIPAVCYMEAFSALEDDRKRRNRFKNELENHIAQLRRDITSPNARRLLTCLEDALSLNERLSNDVQDRLFEFIARSGAMEGIPLTAAALADSLNRLLIRDPTDNLILFSILHHAREQPPGDKVLLTENAHDFDTPDVQRELSTLGVTKYFRSVDMLLGWMRAQPTPA